MPGRGRRTRNAEYMAYKQDNSCQCSEDLTEQIHIEALETRSNSQTMPRQLNASLPQHDDRTSLQSVQTTQQPFLHNLQPVAYSPLLRDRDMTECQSQTSPSNSHHIAEESRHEDQLPCMTDSQVTVEPRRPHPAQDILCYFGSPTRTRVKRPETKALATTSKPSPPSCRTSPDLLGHELM